MKNYLLVYRMDYSKMPAVAEVTPAMQAEMEVMTKRWMDWIAGIGAEGKLVDRGNRLVPNTGKVVKAAGVVTNGPFTEIKESIGGYSIVQAASFEEATAMAHACPIFAVGGNVEVREVSPL